MYRTFYYIYTLCIYCKMDVIDTILIIVFIILNLTCFIMSTYTMNEVLDSLGNWFVMLTHLLVIPSIFLVYKTRWYLSVLLFSLTSSIIFHLSKLGYIGDENDYERWDVASQNVLITSTFFLLVYKNIPEWAFLYITASGILMASLGELRLASFQVFEYVSAMMFFLLFLYLILRIWRPIQVRDNKYIFLAFMCSVIAGISFIVAEYSTEDSYALIHSIWHCSAYVMLYFSLKSIKNPYQQLIQYRRERDFSS